MARPRIFYAAYISYLMVTERTTFIIQFLYCYINVKGSDSFAADIVVMKYLVTEGVSGFQICRPLYAVIK
jgi:hypothetical protein